MTAQEKMSGILSAAKDGKTIVISTTYKAIQITQKNIDAWDKAGRSLFTVKGDSLYIGRGKYYDCIDYTAIKIY